MLLAGIVALIFLMLANGARAATYTHDCPALDEPCLALAERLEAVEAAISGLPPAPTAVEATVLNWPEPGEPGTTEVAGVVELGADDQERLDLIWIGIWLLAGVTAGLYFGRIVWGEFRQWFHV